MRPAVWRVRVRRAIEDWVNVEAHDPRQAEVEAAKLFGVVSVFNGSAIRGDEAMRPDPTEGVQE